MIPSCIQGRATFSNEDIGSRGEDGQRGLCSELRAVFLIVLPVAVDHYLAVSNALRISSTTQTSSARSDRFVCSDAQPRRVREMGPRNGSEEWVFTCVRLHHISERHEIVRVDIRVGGGFLLATHALLHENLSIRVKPHWINQCLMTIFNSSQSSTYGSEGS